MREPCKTFQKMQTIEPHLVECPGDEIQVMRPLSGHGAKVCGLCRRRNRNEQRERENAQKRARRAQLKKDKMTAGIGAGNVVWTTPKTWTPSVVDTPTLTLHSPQARRFNIFKVRTTTQALQYALNGTTHMATRTEDHVGVSQDEHGVYSQPRQTFATTKSNLIASNGSCDDLMVTKMYDKTSLHHQFKNESQDLLTELVDGPAHRGEKHQPVGLGITMAKDTEWSKSHTETCSLNERDFRTELTKWCTVFDEDDHDNAKEL